MQPTKEPDRQRAGMGMMDHNCETCGKPSGFRCRLCKGDYCRTCLIPHMVHDMQEGRSCAERRW